MSLKIEAPEGFHPDDIYQQLLALGQGLSDREARRAVSALALLLANHIGDKAVLEEAMALVRQMPKLRD